MFMTLFMFLYNKCIKHMNNSISELLIWDNNVLHWDISAFTYQHNYIYDVFYKSIIFYTEASALCT